MAERVEEGQEPVIDGNLRDALWQSGKWSSDFTQIDPIEKATPTEKTRFKIRYNQKNLYIAVMAYDSSPELISRRTSRRDHTRDSDVIFVGIDSYFDRRTAFYFGVNVSGVRSDFIMSEDGEEHDENWDPVWVGKTSINDSGWVAEYRIPLNQLRFAELEEQVWGLQIWRFIHRKQERLFWQYIPKDAKGVVSNFGLLKGIHGVKVPARIELLPYGVSSINTYQQEEENPFRTGRDFSLNMGIDGKIGITSNLNLDLTVNPDFGQVEADPSVVNLSAFETFFEERRPFFIEGGNIFSFPLFSAGDFSDESLFYSRRIGRNPHYEPDEEDGYPSDYYQIPDQTRILGAAKLSGKTAGGWSIGVLDAVTNKEIAKVRYQNRDYEVTAEPLTNYLVGRLQKDFDAGNTSIGGMITATNRKIEDQHLEFLDKSSYTGGLDFRHQWANKSYYVTGKLFGSHILGDPRAITSLQESSARYFQRPDNNYVNYDSSRTTFSGFGGNFEIGRYGNSSWEYAGGISWRSPELELNDLGYMRSTDQLLTYGWGAYNQRNPIGIFRKFAITLGLWQGWNFGGDRIDQGLISSSRFQFLNYWDMRFEINRENPVFSPHLLRGGPLARREGRWNLSFNVGSDDRKDLEASLGYSLGYSDDAISRDDRIRMRISYKVNSNFRFSLHPSVSYETENLQYVDTYDFSNEDRYVFGKIDQTTYALVFRVDYSPTPDISLQFFGQPFFSTGHYDNFKHINNPRGIKADRYHIYDDNEISYNPVADEYNISEFGGLNYAFENPDYNVMEFLSNLVFRWEYRPGSTLYLVWSQNRDEENLFFKNDLGSSFNNLYNTHPDNVFLVKMNYWFSF